MRDARSGSSPPDRCLADEHHLRRARQREDRHDARVRVPARATRVERGAVRIELTRERGAAHCASRAHDNAARTARAHPSRDARAAAAFGAGVNDWKRARAEKRGCVGPHAGGDTRESGRAERRRLHHVRPLDRNAEHVGLELHQPVVLRCAAIDAQPIERAARRAAASPRARPPWRTPSPRARRARDARASCRA